jgi:MIP family channel proteins
MLRDYWPKLLAEALGAGVLVFAGCGAIVVERLSGGQVTHVGIALSFGLAIAVMILAVGHVSGAHFNPAVTLALASQRYFRLGLVLPYWGAQCLGALGGALALRALFGVAAGLGRTTPSGSAGQTFALEAILTAILVFVIAMVGLDPKGASAFAAPAVGGTVALEALFAGPITGASMNPARSLAPALVAGQLDGVWIYLTAPLIGGLIGILIYQALRRATLETA